MFKKVFNKIKSEYGTEQMKLESLWGSLIMLFFIIMLELMIKATNIKIVTYSGRYLQLLLSIIAMGIIIGIFFYQKKKKDNVVLQIILSIISVILIVVGGLLLIPIILLFRIKAAAEMISKISLNDLKLQVTMISMVITSIIGGMLLFTYVVLVPHYLDGLGVDYLIALCSFVSVITLYKIATRVAYKMMIKFTKGIAGKRRILKVYYQDYKEQNVILYLIMFIATIYMFVQKDNGVIIQAYVNAITTIILFDTLKDKWKNKLYKREEEFEVIQSIYFDINVISKQVGHVCYKNRNCRLRVLENKEEQFFEYMHRQSKNKRFNIIMETYNVLKKNFIAYEDFDTYLYKLENELIKFKVKYE